MYTMYRVTEMYTILVVFRAMCTKCRYNSCMRARREAQNTTKIVHFQLPTRQTWTLTQMAVAFEDYLKPDRDTSVFFLQTILV